MDKFTQQALEAAEKVTGKPMTDEEIRMENKIELKEDFENAALNLYPEDWQEFSNGFRVDHNASKRDIAEEVFKHVFNALVFDDDLAIGVASAFLRRQGEYAPVSQYDKWEISAHMKTSLTYAVIRIRDMK